MGIMGEQVAAGLAALEVGELEGLQVVSAQTLARQHYPRLDPGQPVLVLGCDAPDAAAAYATLLAAYPPDHPVVALAGGARREGTLGGLGDWGRPHRAAPTAVEALFVPPLPAAGSYEALQDVIAQLRGPGGCPWDRALTWDKLRATLLEETYELLAALDAGDPAKVLEEQGDLLLQVAMQAQIAIEEGLYRPPQVVAAIIEKLVRRHPHVFGDATAADAAEVLVHWEAIKAAERASSGGAKSPLAGVPKGLPALAQAEAYIDRMSRLQPGPVPDAPWAPLAELPPASALDPDLLGEVLFGLVAWSLARGVEAESALRRANARYAAFVARGGA